MLMLQIQVSEPLEGFKPSKPVVFCGLFPVDSFGVSKIKRWFGET